jgi:hypothetical protein
MMRKALLFLALVPLAGACKTKEVTKDNPQTAQDLDTCKKDLKAKDDRIAALEAANSDLMRNGSGGEIVVAIEGNVLTVKPPTGGGSSHPPVDDKVVAAASKEFINVVQKSRGAIQKCYEQALKKNSGLQARTVTLVVNATFSSAGAFQSSAFAPSLGDTFDNCMKTVASKWLLPQNSPAMTFKAQVSLTPS